MHNLYIHNISYWAVDFDLFLLRYFRTVYLFLISFYSVVGIATAVKINCFIHLISLCFSEILSGLGIWFQTYIEVIELKGLTIVIHQYFLGNILITTAKMSSRSGLFETLHVTTPKKYIYHVELNRPNNLNAMNNTLWMWVFEIPTLFIINILIILEK